MPPFPLRAVAVPAVIVAPCLFGAPRPMRAEAPFATLGLLWVQPQPETGAPPGCSRMLVLSQPGSWSSGDAAVLLLASSTAALDAHRRLTEALLRQEAAVLEFPSGPAEGCARRPASQVAEVLGALVALRVEAGAGLVVAIGLDGAGAAALEAAREDVAARHLGPSGPRLAAGIALAAGSAAAFAAGAPPPPAEQWERRAPLLCDALAGAAQGAPRHACLAALLPPLCLGRAPAR